MASRRPRTKDFIARRKIIKIIVTQQTSILIDGIKIPNRIVSLGKDYLRPIVRGKETKSVEFGAKCNNIQVDGISFIQKISFDAFHKVYWPLIVLCYMNDYLIKKFLNLRAIKHMGQMPIENIVHLTIFIHFLFVRVKFHQMKLRKNNCVPILEKERITRL